MDIRREEKERHDEQQQQQQQQHQNAVSVLQCKIYDPRSKLTPQHRAQLTQQLRYLTATATAPAPIAVVPTLEHE
jgi:uncharacterized membrane protein YgcG